MQNTRYDNVPARHIGRVIRDLRKQRNITGVDLANRVGLSQSKIAKIENGYPPAPTPDEVQKILDILDAPKTIRQRISILLNQSDPLSRLHGGYIYYYNFQHVLDVERTTTSTKAFLINSIPALLQTTAWRQTLLSAGGVSGQKLAAAMQASLARQELLWDPARAYHFILPEVALYTMSKSVDLQLAQLDRLQQLASGLENLRLGIIPLESGTTLFETGSFVVYDDNILFMTVGNTELESQDQDTIVQYQNVFVELENKAAYGQEAYDLIRKAIAYFAG